MADTESFRIARLPLHTGRTDRLNDIEKDRVANYLAAGAAILTTTAHQPDRLDPARGNVVPASYRTDGRWVWSDALTYYARTHGLPPEDDLLGWIRDRDYTCPVPDDPAQDRALETLYRSFGRH